MVQGTKREPALPYPDCLQRYISVLNDPEAKHDEHGNQLWGLGYGSSANDEDDDGLDMEADEDEALVAARLSDKILKNDEELNDEEKETVYDSTRLRDVYNNRWWKPNLDQTFFTMYNMSDSKIPKDSQLIFSYGMRGNAYLVEK